MIIGSSSDCNGTRTHNHLVRKRTLNHLRTKWLCVRVPLQSLKLQISRLFREKNYKVRIHPETRT